MKRFLFSHLAVMGVLLTCSGETKAQDASVPKTKAGASASAGVQEDTKKGEARAKADAAMLDALKRGAPLEVEAAARDYAAQYPEGERDVRAVLLQGLATSANVDLDAVARTLEVLKKASKTEDELSHVHQILGNLHFGRKSYGDAEKEMRAAMESKVKRLGADNRGSLYCTMRLGQIVLDAGRRAEAEAFFLRACEGYRKTAPRGHVQRDNALVTLAEFYDFSAATREKTLLLWKEIAEDRESLARDSGPSLYARRIEGRLLRILKRPEESLAILNEILPRVIAQAGGPTDSRAFVHGELGWTLVELDRRAEAAEHFGSAVEIWKKTGEPANSYYLGWRRDLGICLRTLKRHEDAIPLQRETLQLREKFHAADKNAVGWDTLCLADSLHGAGEIEESLTLMKKGIELQRQDANGDTAATLGNLSLLATRLSAHNLHDEAAATIQEVTRRRTAAGGELGKSAGLDYEKLAEIQVAAGRYPEAVAAYEVAFETHLKVHGWKDHLAVRALDMLAQTRLYRLGDHVRAEQDFRRVVEHGEEANLSPDARLSFMVRQAECLRRGGNREEAYRMLLDLVAQAMEKAPAGAALLMAHNQLASIASSKQQWIEARAHYLRMVAMCEERKPVPELEAARNLHLAADMAREAHEQDADQAPQEMLDASCIEADRAFAIRNKALGGEHDDTLSSLWVARVQHTYAGHADTARQLGKVHLEARRKKNCEESIAFAGVLRGVAWTENHLKSYPEGESLLRRAKAILDRLSLDGSASTKTEMALVIQSLANNLENQEKFPEAAQLRREAVALRRELHGAEDDLALKALADLAWNLRTTGDYKESARVYQELLASRRKRHGNDSLQVADTLDGLAYLHEKLQDYSAALAGYTETLRIRRTKLRPDHDDVLESLKDMADILEKQGNFQEGLRYANEAAAMARKKFPAGHEAWDRYCAKQARLMQLSGDVAGAERLLQEDRATVARHCGELSVAHAEAISNLGFFYRRLQQNEKAEKSFEAVLRIYEQLPGRDNELADALDNIASTYQDLLKTEQAVGLQERRIKILRELHPGDHSDVADALFDLARVCVGSNAPRAAEAINEALQIATRTLGPEHVVTREYMLMSSIISPFSGDLVLADKHMQSVLPLIERYSGRQSREYALARMSQTMIYLGMQDMPRAVAAAREAEPLMKRFGEDTGMVDLVLGIHDLMEERIGEGLQRLEAHLQRIAEQKDEARQYALGLVIYVSSIYEANGDQAAADRWLSTAAEWSESSKDMPGFNAAYFHLMKGFRLGVKNDFEGFERCITKALAATDGDKKQSLIRRMAMPMMAIAKISQNRPDEGKKILEESLEQHTVWLRDIFAFGTEQQRLDSNIVHGGFNLPELCLEVADAELAARALLRSKAIALESLAEERRLVLASKDPSLTDLVQQLNAERRSMAAMEGTGDFSRLESLQSELARKVSGLGEARKYLAITPEAVAQRLPANACLVEFGRHSGLGDPRYSAVIITPAGKSILVPLAPANVIDHATAALQAGVRDEATSQADVGKLLRELYALVWHPVQSQLPSNTRMVILSPDGALHFIPFAALLSPGGKFMVEELDIYHVTSGRDLMRQPFVQDSAKRMVAVGDPDFDKPANGTQAKVVTGVTVPWITKEEAAARTFGRLSGTAKELALLKDLAREQSMPFESISEGEVTEARILALSPPYMLHLGTHGFFMGQKAPTQSRILAATRGIAGIRPDATTSSAPGQAAALDPLAILAAAAPPNPMERSGLALAGANQTFATWSRGDRASPVDDGLLSAAEVAEMNLQGTWLVVLSACDTASGELSGSEGVMGLRRGFIQAGATNLMTTLWEISDQETVDFMGEFYRSALASGRPPAALCETQRKWLVRLRNERGLSEAVRIAAPFVLNFVGQP